MNRNKAKAYWRRFTLRANIEGQPTDVMDFNNFVNAITEWENSSRVELPVGMPSETLSCEQVAKYKNFLADIIDTMEKKLIKEEEDFFTQLNKNYVMIIVNIKNEFDRLIASKS